jgi:hypothetical protein
MRCATIIGAVREPIAEIIAMRSDGKSLMAIRDAMRARGFPISHQLVANTIARRAEAEGTA